MPVVGDPSPTADGRDGLQPTPPALPWPERLQEWIRGSPPVSVSLSLHVVVLILLAFCFYPRQDDGAVSIDLSFATEEVVEAPTAGVQIKPEPEPVEEPEVDPVESEKPPVEEAIAAPVMVEEPVEEGAGATAQAVPQNVPIGALLDGREEGRRDALVEAFGGSTATEAAVARALVWLAKQQDKDGLWSLQRPYPDGGSQENRLAATAMALLAFQGAGNTPTEGRHKKVVDRAWKALLAKQFKDGSFDITPLPSHHSLYSHAQATYALCELAAMTGDRTFADPARRAVAYAVAAQGPNGAWRYGPGEEGDTSVTGWFIMALKSAQIAGLDVPAETYERIGTFIDSVSSEGGVKYGYRLDSPQRPPTGVTAAVSAEGLLARQLLGWKHDDRRMAAGIELLLAEKFLDFQNDKDVYAWYYITQVVHNVGGESWKRWNDRLREVMPAEQVTDGPDAGSWDPALDKWGHIGGRLYMTCFCTWMLEVYYRHLPLYSAVTVEPILHPERQAEPAE